jgi:hypothetical protein
METLIEDLRSKMGIFKQRSEEKELEVREAGLNIEQLQR